MLLEFLYDADEAEIRDIVNLYSDARKNYSKYQKAKTSVQSSFILDEIDKLSVI
jgi:hypothetical protein